MTKYTLLEKRTGREWNWKQLGGDPADDQTKIQMPADTTAVFSDILKVNLAKNPSATQCLRSGRNYVYTITGLQHGGARPGAGRKAGGRNQTHLPDHKKRNRIGIRLPQEMIDWLRTQDQPAGRIIESALEAMRTADPKDKR